MTAPPSPPLFDLGFLRDRRAQRRIAVVTLAFSLAAGGWVLLAPRWYRSTVTLAPGKPQKVGGLGALLGGGDLGSLAAGFDAMTGGGVDVARIAAVLRSNAVSDAVVEKLGLQARYGKPSPEAAREELWRHCAVKTVPKPSLVELSCEDRDPRMAREMLQTFAIVGNEAFRRVNEGSASEEARYLDRRVAELRKQADEAAARMRAFQEKHGIVDLDGQARALVSSVAAVTAQKLAKQMELDYTRRFSSADAPGTRQMESQVAVIEEALRDLEVQREDLPAAGTTPGKAKGLFPPAASVPRLRAEYEALYRDRKVAEATLVFALDRLEGARAAEARDVSTFQVLDPPNLPVRRSKPGGLETVLEGALLGLVVGVALAWYESRRAARAG